MGGRQPIPKQTSVASEIFSKEPSCVDSFTGIGRLGGTTLPGKIAEVFDDLWAVLTVLRFCARVGAP